MENPRTTSAREHDDHELIDAAVADAEPEATAGSAGGALQQEVGSKTDLFTDVDEPDGHVRPEKADDLAANQSYPADRGPNRQ